MFDDGDERTLRRTSLCLKGERHFAESEVGWPGLIWRAARDGKVECEFSSLSLLQTLDQLPLTNPEHFGTPVIAKRRSSLPM